MIWMPSYLSSSFGFSLTKSGLWTAVTVVGMTFGILLFGVLADRFARWKIFLLYQFGAVVMVVIYAQLRDPGIMLFTCTIMGMFVNGMIGGYGALISNTFPPQVRATAQSVLFNLGRGVGGFGLVVIGLLSVLLCRGDYPAGADLPAGYRRDPIPAVEKTEPGGCAGGG